MLDALHTWSQFPECLSAIQTVHLVETSQMMRELQKEKIAKSKSDNLSQVSVSWHDSIEEILEQEVDGETFTILIAHEFFDALPVYLLEVGATLACCFLTFSHFPRSRNARTDGTMSL